MHLFGLAELYILHAMHLLDFAESLWIRILHVYSARVEPFGAQLCVPG